MLTTFILEFPHLEWLKEQQDEDNSSSSSYSSYSYTTSTSSVSSDDLSSMSSVKKPKGISVPSHKVVKPKLNHIRFVETQNRKIEDQVMVKTTKFLINFNFI